MAQNPPRPFLWVTGPICEDPAHSHGKRTRDKRGCFCCRESVCVSLLCTPGALLTHSHTPIHTLTRTMHSHTFALIHAHMHLHALTLTFTLICSQTHTYSRAHTLTHMLTHTLTHSHSHTHTRTLSHTHTFFGPPEARAVLVCGHSLPSLRGVRVAGGGRGRLQGSGQHLDSRAEEERDARSARGLLLRERGNTRCREPFTARSPWEGLEGAGLSHDPSRALPQASVRWACEPACSGPGSTAVSAGQRSRSRAAVQRL